MPTTLAEIMNRPRRRFSWRRFMRKVRRLTPRRVWIDRIRPFVQRGQRGWSVPDTWGFDNYLARVIADGVAHLRANLHGYPGDLTPEAWDEILAKIEAGYRAAIDIIDMNYSDPIWTPDKYPELVGRPTYDELMVVYNEGAELFKERFYSLWD